MPQRERAAYVVLLSVFLFGAGYVGAQRLRQPPKIEIDIPKDVRLPLPPTQLTQSATPGKYPFRESIDIQKPTVGPSEVVVDVVGAVKSPGLKHLPVGSRVDDAVKAAGGTASGAQLDTINLAARLEDGQQVVVPKKGEAAPVSRIPGAPTEKTGGKHPPHPIDLGTASIAELEELPGVGPAMAGKLIHYREEHGHLAFEDLRAIPGLGPKRLEKIRPWVR